LYGRGRQRHYDRLSQIVPDVHFIEQRNKAEATQVWSAPDTNGKRVLLAEFKGQHREWVPIEDLKIWRKCGQPKSAGARDA
jgi:hypothetical protein